MGAQSRLGSKCHVFVNTADFLAFGHLLLAPEH
jgi:hypothetical protein